MKNFHLSALIACLVLALVSSANSFQADKKVCFNSGTCVNAEIADTGALREKGLMFREALKDDEAMLFVFDEVCLPSFWMKNVKFPLDIIWIDSDKKIVGIKEEAPVCEQGCEVYPPEKQCKFALEVNAGFVRKNNLKIGDSVNF